MTANQKLADALLKAWKALKKEEQGVARESCKRSVQCLLRKGNAEVLKMMSAGETPNG